MKLISEQLANKIIYQLSQSVGKWQDITDLMNEIKSTPTQEKPKDDKS